MLLAQQQLLEPAPARVIRVPHGHDSHWGIDPGTRRLAVASVGPDGRRTQLVEYEKCRGAARLSDIYAVTRRFVGELLRFGWGPPGLVMFELAAGDPPNLELLYACGVQQAAVYDAVRDRTGHAVDVETMPTGRWKKAACGAGNLYKPRKDRRGPSGEWPARFEDYQVAVWAREMGYTGTSWDCADALGLAEAARLTVALEPETA